MGDECWEPWSSPDCAGSATHERSARALVDLSSAGRRGELITHVTEAARGLMHGRFELADLPSVAVRTAAVVVAFSLLKMRLYNSER